MQINFTGQVKTAPWNKCLNQLTYIRRQKAKQFTIYLSGQDRWFES